MMNKSLVLIKEFHTTFNAPISSNIQIPSKERVQLRLSLILEELAELAVASGKKALFEELLEEKLKQLKKTKEVKPSIEETIDAFCDLQVVLNGSILEYGLHNIFDQAFDKVQDSNMSKTCLNEEDAIKSVEKYKCNNIDTYYKRVNNKFVIYRKSDDKILKGIHFYTPNFKDLIK